MGFSVAAVLGGVLARHGYGLLFWVDALTCLLFGTVIWRGLPADQRDSGARRSAATGSYLAVLRDRVMTAYVLLLLLHASVQFQVATTLPLAMGLDGLSPTDFGVAAALNGAVVVICQPFVLKRLGRFDHSRVMGAGVALLGLGFGCTALAHSLPAYCLTVVVWTTGEITIAAVVQTIVADLAPEWLRGRYNGLFGAAFALASVVAPAGGSALLAHFGPTVLWVTCLAVCLAAALGQLALGRAIRARRDRPDEEPEPAPDTPPAVSERLLEVPGPA
jgi:MFS family permease